MFSLENSKIIAEGDVSELFSSAGSGGAESEQQAHPQRQGVRDWAALLACFPAPRLLPDT